jgi:hypothetical protein
MSAQPQAIPFTRWTPLSAPIDPTETLICMRAQSALSGPELGVVHDLTVEQARDVIAWYSPKH